VRAGVPAGENAAGFEAAVKFAERAAAREAARDSKSTDYSIREALTRLRAEHLTERKRFENALKTADEVLQRVREERRALAVKGYCEYRLGVYEPEKYNESLRHFQAILDVRTAEDDAYRLYAIECLAKIKHWQSLEEKIISFDQRLGNDWVTSESYGIRVLTDQSMLRFSDANSGVGATQDGGPGLPGTPDPTVFAKNEKLFDKASFELVEMLIQIPRMDKNGGPTNNVNFGIAIQPGGAGKAGLKQQGLAVLWDKSKLAVRVAGGMDPLFKDGAVRRLVAKAGGEVDWPEGDANGMVRLSIERVDHKKGVFAVRLDGEKVLEDTIPAFKEAKGAFELWIGGWSNQAANWDARIDNIRIVRRRAP
jgi:tetratricopeptide (TPR) repeat protein